MSPLGPVSMAGPSKVALPSLLRSAADRLSHILDRNTLNDEEYQ